MKANELMIGDWVENDFGEIQKVVELREIGAMLSYNDIYSYDEIEPIPLTPEILKKNGWKYNKDYWMWDNDDACFLSLIEGKDRNAFWWGNPSIIVCPINYVHELQHALRLCGIDLEIQL